MDEFLTVEELAAKLKVPKSWLYRRTMFKGENHIPFMRLGKYLRFSENAVQAWLLANQGNRNE